MATLLQHLHVTRLHLFVKSVSSYRATLRANVRALWTGTWDEFEFVSAMTSSILSGLTAAHDEGLASVGATSVDVSPDERRELRQVIQNETGRVDSLTDFVLENSKAKGGKLQACFDRLQLWVNRYDQVVGMGVVAGSSSEDNLLWELGATEEHCFPAGTMIWTESGQVPIESVRVGERVYTRDGLKRVTKLHEHQYKGMMVNVGTKHGTVSATANHPIFTQRGWVEAGKLEKSDKLFFNQDAIDQLEGKVTLPNSNHSIAALRKISILRPISFLLFVLSFGKWFKSRVSMPVIAVNLNDKVSESSVHRKIGFDNRIRLKGRAYILEYVKKFHLKLRGVFLTVRLSHKSEFLELIFMTIARMGKNLFDSFRVFHRIMVRHIFSSPFCLSLFSGFFGEQYPDMLVDYRSHTGRGHAHLLSDLGAIEVPVEFFYLVYNGLFSFLWARLQGVQLVPALDGAGFSPYSPGVNYAGLEHRSPNRAGDILEYPSLVSANGRTKSIWRDRRGQVSGKLNPTQFAVSSLHHSSIISYYKTSSITTVYNLSVEDLPEYFANGFLVHNCPECQALNGTVASKAAWNASGLKPKSPPNPRLTCGGWKCACSLNPTSEPATKGGIPGV